MLLVTYVWQKYKHKIKNRYVPFGKWLCTGYFNEVRSRIPLAQIFIRDFLSPTPLSVFPWRILWLRLVTLN